MTGPMSVRTALLTSLVSILGAHALAFHIIKYLPEPALLILGIFSGDESAFSEVARQVQLPGYTTTLWATLGGDLGRTLDNTPVSRELLTAFSFSAPRILATICLCFAIGHLTALRASVTSGRNWGALGFLLFMPAFVVPLAVFTFLQFLVAMDAVHLGEVVTELACIVATSVGPASLAFVQARSIMKDLSTKQYARRLKSIGATERQEREFLLREFYVQFLPSLEKMILSVVTFLIFSEFIFNLPGIGKFALQAVTRTDGFSLLGIVLLFSLLVNASRIAIAGSLAWCIRR